MLAPSVSQLRRRATTASASACSTARGPRSPTRAAAVYVAPAGGGQASGPYVARYESLEVKPQFQSQTTSADPDAAKTRLRRRAARSSKPGKYEVLGIARARRPAGGRHVGAPQAAGRRRRRGPACRPRATRRRAIHTPDRGRRRRRHRVDRHAHAAVDHARGRLRRRGRQEAGRAAVRDAALCQSRVCGPVVDIAEQVKADVRRRASSSSTWRSSATTTSPRASARRSRAFSLPTEPWVFTFDKDGKVAARIEGAFSAAELERAIKQALKE